jgi:hypothetical protein
VATAAYSHTPSNPNYQIDILQTRHHKTITEITYDNNIHIYTDIKVNTTNLAKSDK